MVLNNCRLFLILALLMICGSSFEIKSQPAISSQMLVCQAPTFNQSREYFIDFRTLPGKMTITDLNGDNRRDLVIGEAATGGATTMTIMPGIGNFGGFADETNYSIGGNPIDFTTADVNNDGYPDVINTQYGIIDIFLGNGDGSVQTQPIHFHPAPTANIRFSFTLAKDFNGDGKIDLAISTSDYPSRLYICFGNGDGTFNTTQTFSDNDFEFYKIFDVNLNNDGFSDLIIPTGSGNPSRIYFGMANGTFSQAVAGPRLSAFELQFFDLNGDGFKDIYTVGREDSVQIFYNNGQGGFLAPVTISLNIPSSYSITQGAAADFTGDGILDVVALTNVPDIRIYRGTSPTSLALTQLIPLIDYPYALRIADFDHDGLSDFTYAGGQSSSIYVYINKCGNASPTYSIGGNLFNLEGFFINSARVKINSDSVGSISTVSQSGSYFFADLPAGQNYSIIPTHNLFYFEPLSQTVVDLNTNRQIDFEGKIKKFTVYGQVGETGTDSPAGNVPMRLVGPFNTDLRINTDANGNYRFGNLYPIPDNQFYQIQFEPNPIFRPPNGTFNIFGLSGDAIRNFTLTRYRYSITSHVTTANGQPRSGVVFFQNGTNNFTVTDSNGQGTINNFKAGFSYTIVPGTPSLRFTPAVGVVDFLSGNADLNFRVARRNPTDFDNDGKTDLAVWRPSTGTWYVLQTSDNQFWGNNFGLSTDIPVPADYDGDQKTDIAVFRPSDGSWHMILSATQNYLVSNFGTNGDVPVPGDFDRDGKTDITVFRPSSGVWYTYQSYFQNVVVNNWGTAGDRPLVGDFDGDSYLDRVVYRPGTGVWYIQYSGSSGFQAIQFGLPTDKVLTGDFDGDTKADLVAWRPETGVWYILKSTDNSVGILAFGTAGDIPLNGDFDGDGLDDIAVYRPSSRVWYVWKSSDNGFLINTFGLSEDIPVPSTMVR